MAGYNQAAVQATAVYQSNIKKIMQKFGIDYRDARNYYAEHRDEFRKTNGARPKRTRRSSFTLLFTRLLLAKKFVKECGGLKNAREILKHYEEIL